MIMSKRSNFNPRSPCGERPGSRKSKFKRLKFQSTLPVWGATSFCPVIQCSHGYFNPRSPCGERQRTALFLTLTYDISIHAPRVGSDLRLPAKLLENPYFNPRSPCGERPDLAALERVYGNFNPRSPCGERQSIRSAQARERSFQSTLPVWGATIPQLVCKASDFISIHAPRVGSDPSRRPQRNERTNFNPRSPCGERLFVCRKLAWM